jgi:hypothetical protein
MVARRWLNESRWRDVAAPKFGPSNPRLVWIEYGSPEWRAWDAHYRQTRGKSPPVDAKGGWRRPNRSRWLHGFNQGGTAMISLVTPSGRLDRRAVMTEAHRQYRLMRRYGWSFGRWLSFAWAKAREQRARLSHGAGLPMAA